MLEDLDRRKRRRRVKGRIPRTTGRARAKPRKQERLPVPQTAAAPEVWGQGHLGSGGGVGRRPGRTNLDARQSPELELLSADD